MHEGRLAGARLTDNRDRFARIDIDVDTFEGFKTCVTLTVDLFQAFSR